MRRLLWNTTRKEPKTFIGTGPPKKPESFLKLRFCKGGIKMMINKQDHKTLFSDRKKAYSIAEENNQTDPDWFYKVIRCGNYWVIEIYDETKTHIGNL